MKIIYTKTELIKETSEKAIFKAVSGNNPIIVKEFSEDKREIYTLLKNKKIPGVPEIYSVELNDRSIITEEYIDGISLYDFIRDNKAVNLKTALKIAIETSAIISDLHSIGIIHRDITPSNIFISKENKVYIVDFDIARTYKPEAPKDTQLLGTVGYAPPEQFGFGSTDYKSDIYAFGMTMKDLFFLVREKHPYTKIFEKCTAFDPERRYKSMHAVVKSLKSSSKKSSVVLTTFLVTLILICSTALFAIETNKPTQNQNGDISNSIHKSDNKKSASPHTDNSDNAPQGKEDSSFEKDSDPQNSSVIPADSNSDSTAQSETTESETPDISKAKDSAAETQKQPPKSEKQTAPPDSSKVRDKAETQSPKAEKIPTDTPKPIEYKCFFCDNPPVTIIGQNRYCAEHAPKCTNCGKPLSGQHSGLCESCAFKKAAEQDAT